MIKEIEINGKLEKFSFGLGMLGDMLFKLNVGWLKFDEMQAENPFKYTPIKMMHSYNYANDLEVTEKEFLKMLNDDVHHPAIERFNILFMESLTKNVTTQEKKTLNKAK